MPEPPAARAPFAGWDVPHTTQVPDMLFDELLPDLSGAELKVLLYIIRRTFGFKKQADAISLSQLKDGIRKTDGTILDRGTGLAESTILAALKSLDAAGYIRKESAQLPDGVNTTNVYSLRFREDATVPRFSRDGGPKISATVPRLSGTQQTVESTDRENGYDPQLLAAIRTFAGRCRQTVTPEHVAALAHAAGTLARWQAVSADARSLGDVQARLGEG